jgi:hypothetical protein
MQYIPQCEDLLVGMGGVKRGLCVLRVAMPGLDMCS